MWYVTVSVALPVPLKRETLWFAVSSSPPVLAVLRVLVDGTLIDLSTYEVCDFQEKRVNIRRQRGRVV